MRRSHPLASARGRDSSVAVAACIVVGLPVAFLVSLVHRRKAHRIMAEWQPYRCRGDAPEGQASKAA
jgi:hypothetical protein